MHADMLYEEIAKRTQTAGKGALVFKLRASTTHFRGVDRGELLGHCKRHALAQLPILLPWLDLERVDLKRLLRGLRGQVMFLESWSNRPDEDALRAPEYPLMQSIVHQLQKMLDVSEVMSWHALNRFHKLLFVVTLAELLATEVYKFHQRATPTSSDAASETAMTTLAENAGANARSPTAFASRSTDDRDKIIPHAVQSRSALQKQQQQQHSTLPRMQFTFVDRLE